MLGLVFSLQLLVKNCKLLNQSIINNSRSLPRNKKAGVILWVSLNIFWFRTTNCRKKKNTIIDTTVSLQDLTSKTYSMKTSADFISKECNELHLPTVELWFTPFPVCEILLPPACVYLFRSYLLIQERMR